MRYNDYMDNINEITVFLKKKYKYKIIKRK